MYIIIGLGNPGKKYANTRHNIGFMVAKKLKSKNEKIKIIKPSNYMNRSGESVKGYKASDIVLIHDDVDLPLGTIRVRRGGSSAGHRGVQSVVDKLNSNKFFRVRIGISRPPAGMETEDYVLQNFRGDETPLLNQTIDEASEFVINSLKSGEFIETTIIV